MSDDRAGAGCGLSDIADAATTLRRVAQDKTQRIRRITHQVKMLALNARIESSRVGEQGRGFTVVANEVGAVGEAIAGLARELEADVDGRIVGLQEQVSRLVTQAQGERLIDLALNAVELIDRNLYERTCDVRWWATDAAVVACAAEPDVGSAAFAEKRLGVILSAYTVYLDLWLCDLEGRVIATGRPDRFPGLRGQSVAQEPWFREAAALASGDAYSAADIRAEPRLGGAQVATYCASVREGGEASGRPLGVLAIHFDWQPQARAIVQGVRVAPEDRARTRVLLVDAAHRVIAASDGAGLLTERLRLDLADPVSGVVPTRGAQGPAAKGLVAYHRTPGYETYQGLGWYGVIVQGAG
ncbi:methyl-accepting chemotaxis protein [Methylobacterium terricola]|uniref:Methyl-accepting chemotaxis protein n=1 Tax=Methylobacterium terricola TaxID=2583531 RepID=A0A5C4LQX8_9HYPH|nr:methyl-accepting chemotaxis protein [Methylobacterium terricola]